MLTGDEIRDGGFVEGASPERYRASSYDLTIGLIIGPGGDILQGYNLPPQGIVEVVSKERLLLPTNVVAMSMVKTGLCNEGLLALNIGIVDPGWHGKISSFLVNFSKLERRLVAGEVFMRVTFENLSSTSSFAKVVNIADEVYVSSRQVNSVARFSTTFLDLSSLTAGLVDATFKRYRNGFLALVSAAAFVLALTTFFLNFGNLLLVQRWIVPNDAAKAEIERDALDREKRDVVDNSANSERAVSLELSTLSNRIATLEKTQSVPPATTLVAPNPRPTIPVKRHRGR